MEVRSEYRQTEVGGIPESWKTKQLCELGSTFSGLTGKTKEDFGHGTGRYVTFLNVVANTVIDCDMFERVNVSSAESQNKILKGDILFNGSSETPDEVALCSLLTVSVPNLFLNSFCFGLRLHDDKNTDGLFLVYYLRSSEGRQLLRALAQGSTRYNLSKTALLKLPLRWPSFFEQRAIAGALSDMDGLLGALEALIAKKQAIKQATMQQLLTGKTRLPGFSGKWEMRRLGQYVTFLRTGTYARAELSGESSIKYLHYGDIHTTTCVRLDPRIDFVPGLSHEKARTLSRLRDGDLVFADASEDLDGVGKSVEITGASDIEVVSGLHTIAARFEKVILADGFKAYLQFCPAFRDHLRRLAAGTKVYATYRSHIASAEICLPGTREQTAIAAVLSDMDAEITALERRRDKTRAIKQGMMQQLLTGKIRLVRTEAAS